MELNTQFKEIEKHGVNVVAITYDDWEQNGRFIAEREIAYTILSDQDVKTVLGFDILNEDWKPGHPAYGIPRPGVLMADANGKIIFKLALPRYQDRPPMQEIVAAVEKATSNES